LEQLGQRWGNICRWVENHWLTLQAAGDALKLFNDRHKLFDDWLSESEKTVAYFPLYSGGGGGDVSQQTAEHALTVKVCI